MKLVLASLLCLLGSLGHWWVAAPGEPPSQAMASLAPSPPTAAPGRSMASAWVVPPQALPGLEDDQADDQEDALDDALDEEPVSGVSGRVMVEGGALPAELEVYALAQERPTEEDLEDGWERVVHAHVEEDGQFELELPPGRWTLVARSPGLRPAVVEGFRLHEGELREGEALTLRQGLSITGRVFSAEGPGDSIRVQVEGQGERRVAYTGEDGTFVVGGLAPGFYRVQALDSYDGSDEREVAAGQSVVLTLRLGTLRGVAVAYDGRPLPGARILLLSRALPDADEDPWTAEQEPPVGWECLGGDCDVRTDDEGRFEVEVPPHASLAVAAVHGEYSAPLREIEASGRGEQVIRLTDSERLRVRIFSDEGAPAPEQSLALRAAAPAHVDLGTHRANAEGEVTVTLIGGLPLEAFPHLGYRLEQYGQGFAEGLLLRPARPAARRGCMLTVVTTSPD